MSRNYSSLQNRTHGLGKILPRVLQLNFVKMLIEHVKYELTCKSHRVVFRYTPFVVDWVKSGTPSHSDPLPDQSLLLVNCQRYISADGTEE